MAITVNLRYSGTGGNARAFSEEMMSSGTVDKIRAEKGNLRYEYYISLDDPETEYILLKMKQRKKIFVLIYVVNLRMMKNISKRNLRMHFQECAASN